MWERYYSLMNNRRNNKSKSVRKTINKEKQDTFREYYAGETQPGFKISEAKKQISDLSKRIELYEEELLWMSNFVATFIKTIQNIAVKKYQEHILINEWSLKKKSKVSWRYLKHILTHLYS